MQLDQQKFVEFANMIEECIERLNDIKSEIADHFDGFREENDIEKKDGKFLKSSVKKYLKWKKDQAKFNEAERIENTFLDILTGEKCIKFTDGTEKEI